MMKWELQPAGGTLPSRVTITVSVLLCVLAVSHGSAEQVTPQVIS